jgi:heat-inducible transcriptional repressor
MTADMLDERTRQILFAVVESYINKPEPVGSRFVTKRYSFGFSSATIRNIMADLEESGFLSQPHTSAGRMPTDKGYRFYVDSLFDKGVSRSLISRSIDDKDLSVEQDRAIGEFLCQFARKLERMKSDMNKMFIEVTNTLSLMSNYIGVAMPPKTEHARLNRIDLIKYKEGRAVAILLTDEGIVRNKILKIDSRLTQEDLNRIAEYLNSWYAGYAINEIKKMLFKRIKYEKMVWDDLISKAIKIYEQAISFVGEDIFISNIYDVMNLPDFSDISRLKEIAAAIKDKHIMLRFLDELLHGEGVQVLIGSENPDRQLKNLSIVASTYKEGDRPIGVIALIGPTRMNYSKAIYMVDTIAKCISKTF